MFKRVILLHLLSLFLSSLSCHAQHLAISNNLLFTADRALSAGVEMPFAKKTSLEVYGSLRPWKRGEQEVHKHWLLQVQHRYWPCQVMNGFFFGPYVHAGQFNLGNHSMPLGLLRGLKPQRYEGWLAGVGVGAGYEYAVAKHWNIGAEAGLGYTYIDYDKFNCEVCGKRKDAGTYHYVGLSKLALSLIYIF